VTTTGPCWLLLVLNSPYSTPPAPTMNSRQQQSSTTTPPRSHHTMLLLRFSFNLSSPWFLDSRRPSGTLAAIQSTCACGVL
jgi:hypothetical protein